MTQETPKEPKVIQHGNHRKDLALKHIIPPTHKKATPMLPPRLKKKKKQKTEKYKTM
ncbi:hypothetical protein [Deinococcus sp. ME38]|uniref:hypothetical protein n=1 Tax=Deinococcus sp. ME38 TaxID=3400344 RepID=UPI003B5B34BA